MHLPSGRAASPSITFAGHERTLSGRLAFVLLGLTCTLGLALFVGLTFSTSTAPAAFPGTNGPIACSGPLGPNPPPPNGSFLEIFTMDDSGEIDATTGAPTSQDRLQDNIASDFNPRYSADGTKIAFVKQTAANPAGAIWTMNADGTGETAVTTGTTSDSFVGGWSPDGNQIVFQRSVPAADGNPANFEVFKVNADGTGLTNLTNNPGSETVGNSDSQPSWSPDGTKIAFQSNRLGSPDIWVMNADGTDPRPLTADSYAEESAPEFSPDGQQIAFQSDRGFIPLPADAGRNLEIYRMNAVDGSNVTRLTNNPFVAEDEFGFSGFDLNPHWSPQGDRIVFHSGRGLEFDRGQWDVFTIDAVAGDASQPARRLTRRNFNDERCGWGVATPYNLLSVEKAGAGEGTVTAPDMAINCGLDPEALDCAQGYAPGTTVTLTAVPEAGTGSTFTGFTGGGCSGASPTCTVTVDAATTVTATFDDADPRISVTKAGSGARKAGTGEGTVTSQPAGIACGADCTEEYPDGTPVTLYANPAPGSTFDGFTGGGCSGSGSTCTVTADQARTVTAIFSGPLLTVRRTGTGATSAFSVVRSGPPADVTEPEAVERTFGINCGTDCSEDYHEGTEVLLTATVNPQNNAGGLGATFAGFTGCDSTPSATTCLVTLDEAKTVTANFVDFPTLTVNKTGAGTGTVTSGSGGLACGATCSRDFPKDSTVTLTAVPAAGSDFVGFTGCVTTPTANTCTVKVDQARAVVARFELTPAPAPPPPPPPPPSADAPPPPPPPPLAAVTPRGIGSLSASVTPGRDLRAPYVFRTSGRLTRPAGVSAADGCSGRVSVQVKGGRSGGVTISTRRVTLSRTCRYSLRVSFGNTRRFGTAKRLKVTARFLGNAKVLPDTAAIRYVRVRP